MPTINVSLHVVDQYHLVQVPLQLVTLLISAALLTCSASVNTCMIKSATVSIWKVIPNTIVPHIPYNAKCCPPFDKLRHGAVPNHCSYCVGNVGMSLGQLPHWWTDQLTERPAPWWKLSTSQRSRSYCFQGPAWMVLWRRARISSKLFKAAPDQHD